MEEKKSERTLASAIDYVHETVDDSQKEVEQNKKLVLEKQKEKASILSNLNTIHKVATMSLCFCQCY